MVVINNENWNYFVYIILVGTTKICTIDLLYCIYINTINVKYVLFTSIVQCYKNKFGQDHLDFKLGCFFQVVGGSSQ